MFSKKGNDHTGLMLTFKFKKKLHSDRYDNQFSQKKLTLFLLSPFSSTFLVSGYKGSFTDLLIVIIWQFLY